MRIETKIGLISASVIIIAAACGGRSGTEIFGYEDRLSDAGPAGSGGTGGFGGGVVDGGSGGGGTSGSGGVAGGGGALPDADVPDVSIDVEPPVDAASDAKDFFDTLPPLPDSGPIGDCMSCLEQECGDEINACYNDPNCVEGIQCTVTECASGGGTGGDGGSGGGGGDIDFQCVLGCFNNDMGSVMTALAAFQCVTQSCGELCGLGSGGSGGGNGDGQMNGMNLPSALLPRHVRPFARNRGYYIGTTRVPRPEEVASVYPWFAEVLAGRMPNPLPPCIVKKRAAH